MTTVSLSEDRLNALAEGIAIRLIEAHYFAQGNISGEALKTFCPHEQVNKFLLFQVYQVWSMQVSRLRHPYFNFEHPQVSQTLTHLQNLLSQHISISREDFQQLLSKAVYNHLRLLLMPRAAFSDFFFSGNEKLSLKTFEKYAPFFSDFDFALNSVVRYCQKNGIETLDSDIFFLKFDKACTLYSEKSGKNIDDYRNELLSLLIDRSLADLQIEAEREQAAKAEAEAVAAMLREEMDAAARKRADQDQQTAEAEAQQKAAALAATAAAEAEALAAAATAEADALAAAAAEEEARQREAQAQREREQSFFDTLAMQAPTPQTVFDLEDDAHVQQPVALSDAPLEETPLLVADDSIAHSGSSTLQFPDFETGNEDTTQQISSEILPAEAEAVGSGDVTENVQEEVAPPTPDDIFHTDYHSTSDFPLVFIAPPTTEKYLAGESIIDDSPSSDENYSVAETDAAEIPADGLVASVFTFSETTEDETAPVEEAPTNNIFGSFFQETPAAESSDVAETSAAEIPADGLVASVFTFSETTEEATAPVEEAPTNNVFGSFFQEIPAADAPAEETPPTDTFASLIGDTTTTETPAEATPVAEAVEATPFFIETVAETVSEEIAETTPEIAPDTEYVADAVSETPTHENEYEADDDSPHEALSLADRFSRPVTVGTKIRLEGIPIHKQFQYVKKVFDGNNARFRIIIDKINEAPDATEVEDLVQRFVLSQTGVSLSEPVVEEFVILMRSRFS